MVARQSLRSGISVVPAERMWTPPGLAVQAATEGLPAAPVYLAALGPQMLRLAGQTADGALLNWATPKRIAVSRSAIDAGAARAGRTPGAVPMTMYIRVCIDDDAAAARQAVGYCGPAGPAPAPGPPRWWPARSLFLVSRVWALMRGRPAGNSAACWWRSRVTAPGGVRIVTLAGRLLCRVT